MLNFIMGSRYPIKMPPKGRLQPQKVRLRVFQAHIFFEQMEKYPSMEVKILEVNSLFSVLQSKGVINRFNDFWPIPEAVIFANGKSRNIVKNVGIAV